MSAGFGYQFYNSSLEAFRRQKAEEKIAALQLVDAFVTTYSQFRSQFVASAPVPATFKAQAIENFSKEAGTNGAFLLRWVGRKGREIATPAADSDMAETIEALAALGDANPRSALSTIDGKLVLRTVYPTLAREESCVNCHNELQPNKPKWQINDVMGAFAIDVPMEEFLRELRRQSYKVGGGLFLVLGAIGVVISILHFRHVSQWDAVAQELSVQNTRFDAALKYMSQGLCMFDADARLVVANDRYAEMYGLTREQVKPGTPFRAIVEARIALGAYSGPNPESYINERLAAVRERHASTKIQTLPDGRVIAIVHQPLADGGWVATHEDITEQRRYEAKIAHMAHHDALTDLPNRVLLNERLQTALDQAGQDNLVAIHLLDLDLFKNVNDTLGHAAGDKLLKAVADRLRSVVRETDTVARMGGDEFAIVQQSIGHPMDAAMLAERVIASVSAAYEVDGHQVVVGTSLGIAVGPTDGKDPDQLTRNADLALYRAKSAGRGGFAFFEAGMDVQMQERRALENDMRAALPAGQFELHYQPVLNLARNEIVGVEALVRWRHPERGMISPGEFIPLAEEVGFIVPLGEWVIRQACATAAGWPSTVKVAVNLSPAQFRSTGLVQVVMNALASSGLAPDRLELEITENILLQDGTSTLATLHRLRELGVHIAMDDFGTGYSSLSYLRSFPFDKIKIDRSFVKDITVTSGSLSIVRAVAAMAKGLGMETTAEGVETQEQLETVKSEGCTEIQGYLLSRPLPANEIEQLLRRPVVTATPAEEHAA
ncbi:MAG TPA: EAL domain-containing protein [Hyphomicrobiaceae bacterium]|nr:EAL domain-containing protein [Hyphomicrobiaceae bacterium]